MNTDPLYQKIREQGWRRPLTDAEQAQVRQLLRDHPDWQVDWESESALNESLHHLADAPVPSNFTARVLQAVEREELAAQRPAARPFWQRWARWLPRTAVAGLMVGLSVAFFARLQVREEQLEMVESVATVAEVSSLPSPEILKDFEVIRALSQTPPADEQLLTLLQ